MLDTESPVFVNQQFQNISNMVNCTDPVITVSWDEPNASDNSGEYTLSSNYKPGDEFAVGETTMVTYNAADPSGNVAKFSFFVSLSGNYYWISIHYKTSLQPKNYINKNLGQT